jgi:hypothetical protein
MHYKKISGKSCSSIIDRDPISFSLNANSLSTYLVKPFLEPPADIIRGCRTGPLLPVPFIIFFLAVDADIGIGALQKSRFIIASYNIVFAVPATILGQ